MAPIATSQADAVQFQSWLRARQFPADCSSSVGMFTRQDYFYALGLGAQMVSLKYGLLHAILQGRVYHFPTSHYVNPVRCPSRSFDCYFEPASNCSRPAKAGRQPKGRAARNPREHRRAVEWYRTTNARAPTRPRQSRVVGPLGSPIASALPGRARRGSSRASPRRQRAAPSRPS